jgi:hypothetical protein
LAVQIGEFVQNVDEKLQTLPDGQLFRLAEHCCWTHLLLTQSVSEPQSADFVHDFCWQVLEVLLQNAPRVAQFEPSPWQATRMQ